MTRETIAVVISILLACAGCGPRQGGLSEKEAALAAATGIPAGLLLEVKHAGKKLRQLQGMDPNGDPLWAAGVTIDVAPAKVPRTLRRLQQKAGTGYFAFLSERNYGIEGRLDSVSLLKASDPYDMLRTMGTNGANYDISPDMIIDRLRKWDTEFGLVLSGVGFDWLEAQFQRQPGNMLEYAKEIYAFCPDVVEQGTETVEALAAEMKRTNTLFLWWD